MPASDAVRRTIATAGRTVVFSALTVAAAMASLLVFPQRFLFSMGVGGVLVALAGGTVSLVVLPAVLALLGRRVDALAPQTLAAARGRLRRRRVVPLLALRHAARGDRRRGERDRVDRIRPAVPARPLHRGRLARPAARARARASSTSGSRTTSAQTTTPFYAVARGDRRAAAAFARAWRRSPASCASGRSSSHAKSGSSTCVTNADYLSGDAARLVREIRALPTPLTVQVGGGSAGFADEKASLDRASPARARARSSSRRCSSSS